MTLFTMYEQKLIRLTDDQGNTFTGIADVFPAEYTMHEYGREEEAVRLGDYVIYKSNVAKVEILPTYEEATAAIPPGRYRHFKGKEYEVIGIARHSETEEAMVVYRALYDSGRLWVRPASMWNETVERGGKTYRRFYRLDRIERVEKYEQLFDEVTAKLNDSADEMTGDKVEAKETAPDISEKLRLLETYYTSGEWQADYEADERGELPPDLKRGVLAQDALYDLLEGQ